MRALLKEKADRFQSARDMRIAIRAAMDGSALPVDAVAPTVSGMAPNTGPSQPQSAQVVAASPQIGAQTTPNLGLPNTPAIISSKTTPLGTAVVAEPPRPPQPPSKAPLFAGSESVYSGDYVGWLESQAIPLGQEAKYLEIVANNAGGQATTFEASNTTFQEWSWSFDVTAYAGVSGGGGVDFFGIGEA